MTIISRISAQVRLRSPLRLRFIDWTRKRESFLNVSVCNFHFLAYLSVSNKGDPSEEETKVKQCGTFPEGGYAEFPEKGIVQEKHLPCV